MQPDISHLTVAELKKLTDKAEALIESKKEQELDEAYNKIAQIAADAGVSLQDLIARGEGSAKAANRKPVPARYHNPENTAETWTGRGKQPRWLAAKISDGANLEDFLI